jgi:uncharacterized membrane protein
MAPTATRQASAVRKRHAEHPNKPQPASKPGEPSSSSAESRRGNRRSGGGGRGESGAESAGGDAGTDGAERQPDGVGSKLMTKLSDVTDRFGDKLPHLPEVREMSASTPHLPKPHFSIWTRLVGKVLKKIARHELKRLAKAANWSLEPADTEEIKAKLGELAPDLGAFRPKLPIQVAVDVAVPLDFAWSEWMTLRFLPEGVGRVVDIERDGGDLSGRMDGDSHESWSATVLDERDRESFAWRSTEGSDCAGLVTFHSLSERLTRVELMLDVLPQDVTESALLLARVAHRRARNELRKFKADLELVSPDVYTGDEHSSSQ